MRAAVAQREELALHIEEPIDRPATVTILRPPGGISSTALPHTAPLLPSNAGTESAEAQRTRRKETAF